MQIILVYVGEMLLGLGVTSLLVWEFISNRKSIGMLIQGCILLLAGLIAIVKSFLL